MPEILLSLSRKVEPSKYATIYCTGKVERNLMILDKGEYIVARPNIPSSFTKPIWLQAYMGSIPSGGKAKITYINSEGKSEAWTVDVPDAVRVESPALSVVRRDISALATAGLGTIELINQGDTTLYVRHVGVVWGQVGGTSQGMTTQTQGVAWRTPRPGKVKLGRKRG